MNHHHDKLHALWSSKLRAQATSAKPADMRAFDASNLPKHPLPDHLSTIVSSASLDLEIGAGQGFHALTYSLRHPERRLIAVERTINRFKQLQRRFTEHGCPTNLFPIHADAISVVSHWLQNTSLERVFLLYPNPYPKSKHANLRWHNMPFMGQLLRKMKPEGRLTLATNILSYKDEAKFVMEREWGMSLVAEQLVNHSPRTHFEKKYLERGETCWNLVFEKTAKAHTISS
jgi:tRNA G46 methylase TrmB